MDLAELTSGLDAVASSGFVLSVEQKCALQNSLVLLKSLEKFAHVKFWGRINGLRRNYFIAQGSKNDAMSDITWYYSKDDCVNWLRLATPLDPSLAEACAQVRGRFEGSPSAIHKTVVAQKEGEPDLADDVKGFRVAKDDGSRQWEWSIPEDRLLTFVVQQIDSDVALVPRGAYIRTHDGTVMPNRCFTGLDAVSANKLSNFFHFRDPQSLPNKPLLYRSQLDPAVDFLDPASEDLPKGCWSVQAERGEGLTVLRSLLWPGFTAYIVPGTTKFGYVYGGIAQKNEDLAFML